jgi:truncated hemoglobin YjbI
MTYVKAAIVAGKLAVEYSDEIKAAASKTNDALKRAHNNLNELRESQEGINEAESRIQGEEREIQKGDFSRENITRLVKEQAQVAEETDEEIARLNTILGSVEKSVKRLRGERQDLEEVEQKTEEGLEELDQAVEKMIREGRQSELKEEIIEASEAVAQSLEVQLDASEEIAQVLLEAMNEDKDIEQIIERYETTLGNEHEATEEAEKIAEAESLGDLMGKERKLEGLENRDKEELEQELEESKESHEIIINEIRRLVSDISEIEEETRELRSELKTVSQEIDSKKIMRIEEMVEGIMSEASQTKSNLEAKT